MRRDSIVFAFLALVLTGCGGGTGALAGKVYFQDKPLVTGTVFAMGADGVMHSSSISADGSYDFAQLPTGTVQLGVVSLKPEPSDSGFRRAPNAPPPPPPVDVSKWMKIPDRYEKLDQSGLNFTVTTGRNSFDIRLTP